MGIVLKLLLAIFAGYVAAVFASVLWVGELNPGGVIYLLWVVIMFTLPITPPAIAGYVLLVALALWAFLFRRKPFWQHAGMTLMTGLFAAAIISWLITLNGMVAKSMFSVALIPVTAAALAIVAFVRLSFPSSTTTEPPPIASNNRRVSVIVSTLLVIIVGVLFTWLLRLHRELKIWDNVESRLRQVVRAEERFRFVQINRARDGSVFLFGGVESSAALDALLAAIKNARLERAPGIAVTISEPIVTSGAPIVRTRAVHQ